MTEYINNAPNAPSAIGPYSQAAKVGNLVFLSGQIPLDPTHAQIVEGGIEEQTEQVMKNLKAVLLAAKLDFSRVARTTIYLQDMTDFQKVNTIYERHMEKCKPARTTIQVAGLPRGALVEIEMIAVTE